MSKPKPTKRVKKTKQQVCVELKNGAVVCFSGTMDGMVCFIDLIGTGEVKIKSFTPPKKKTK
jgi:hypothetical protein